MKTIAEHAIDVLKETGNNGVMHGDSSLLDTIARRAGVKSNHPLSRWQCILNALDRSDQFDKTFIRFGSVRVRNFTLKST